MRTSRDVVSSMDDTRHEEVVHEEKKVDDKKKKTFSSTAVGSQIGSSPSYGGPWGKPMRGGLGKA